MFDKLSSGLYIPLSHDQNDQLRRISRYKAGLDALTSSFPISDAEMMVAMFQYMEELRAMACKTDEQKAEFDKSVDDALELVRKKRAEAKA